MVIANGDVGAFADAILRVLSDGALARRLGAQARDFARAELSWLSVAERIEEVYLRAVENVAGR